MQVDFYKTYLSFDNEKLKEIVINQNDYQQKAVDTAILILKERNVFNKILNDIERFKNEQLLEQNQSEDIDLSTINLNNQISFDYGDELDFELKLQKRKIKYYRRDFFHRWHKVVFYFPDSEIKKLDRLRNSYTANQANVKYENRITRPIDRFWDFSVKSFVYLLVIIFILFILVVIIDYLFDGFIARHMFNK